MTPGTRRGRGRLPFDVAAMYAAYQTGLSLDEVGRRFGCSGFTVHSRFVEAGLPRQPAHPKRWDVPKADHGDLPLHRPGCPPRRVARCRAAAAAGWRVAALWADLRDEDGASAGAEAAD